MVVVMLAFFLGGNIHSVQDGFAKTIVRGVTL